MNIISIFRQFNIVGLYVVAALLILFIALVTGLTGIDVAFVASLIAGVCAFIYLARQLRATLRSNL